MSAVIKPQADNNASNIRKPSLLRQAMETRAIAELAAYGWLYPLLRMAPRGDGHAVLVLPGFLASGRSTFPLRHILKKLGYMGHRWKLGRNLGPSTIDDGAVLARMHELRQRYDRRVSLIGWSLGGVYARELAWRAPDDVRMVITLGAPLRHHEHTAATWLYNEIHMDHIDPIAPEALDHGYRVPPVPCTAIYSRSDGVVPWQCSLEVEADHTENIRVYGSHCGLGHNPSVLWAIFDRLAQHPDAWRPFDRNQCVGGLVYPRPDRGISASG